MTEASSSSPPAIENLGTIGVWSGQFSLMPASAVREAVPQIEQLGFKAVWYPESFSKEAFAHAATILESGNEVIAATGIANIWARDATAMMSGGRTLEDAYPGRLVLGMGVSHAPSAAKRGGDYRRPLSMMIDYLDDMGTAVYLGPEAGDPPLVLAALGPKMLELAARRTEGAHPYFVPVEHTALARDVMGDGPLLAPEQAVVLSTDADEARTIARRHAVRYLALDNYLNNLHRLGWKPEDTADGGSDALVDAVIAWGDTAAIVERVAAHLEAGADHVSVQVLNGPPDVFPVKEFTELAPALLEL